MSTKRLMLRLLLTRNHRRMRHQWCEERKTWTTEWNDVEFTDEYRFCLQHHDGRIRIELPTWPACSPDLSPIENVWYMIKQRLARDSPPAATLHRWAKIKDEVEKLAYQLNEEAERTERPIRRLSKVMYGSTCADMQVDVMGECLSSIKHVVGVRSVFLAKRLHAV
ncbi:uncharacterized protein TNCV_1479781 [Trichonephila clavipes]|nr:uncharacterized protein TNCV_1479781 [Trichonephila clavipes]